MLFHPRRSRRALLSPLALKRARAREESEKSLLRICVRCEMLSCYDDDDDDDHDDDGGGDGGGSGGGGGGHHRAQPIDGPVLLRARAPTSLFLSFVPFHSHPNDLPSPCVLHPGSRRAPSLLPSSFISSTYVCLLFSTPSCVLCIPSCLFSTSSPFMIFTFLSSFVDFPSKKNFGSCLYFMHSNYPLSRLTSFLFRF